MLLSSAYAVPRESKPFSIVGFTFVYLGWAGILLLCLHVRNVLPRAAARVVSPIGSVFAYFGMFSYSIYLWQGTAQTWLPRIWHLPIFHSTAGLAIFLVADLAIGVAMSKLVEYPVLRLRDRLFPAIAGAPAGAGADVPALPALEQRAVV